VRWDFEGAPARGYDSELHAASAVGRVFRLLPAHVRVATAAPRAEVDQRRVVAATFSEDGAETTILRNAQKYRAEIRIGHGRKGETVASELFPRHLLPESKTGHRLTIVFAELPQHESDAFLQPQVRELTLPPDGDSRAVRFWFRTGDTAPRYDARVIVLYQNRVLQTLRYSAPLDGKTAIALDAELDVYRLDDLDTRTRFDAALVANKAGERMGVCLVVDGKAAYVAPAGLEQQVDKVSSILDEATKLRKLPKTLGDEKLVEVMLKLSHEGNHLWTSLGLEQAGAKLARARRVQVVAAKPGEYLPVEFLYARPVPLQLTMCNHAAAALGGTNDAKCSTTDPATELCPVEFWGLSRVIEHVAWSDAKKHAATARTRGLFESAVVGLSDRVPPADAKKLMTALDLATDGKAHRATSWSDWTSKIAEHKPSLLVLLTHTTIFQITGGPALEMAGDILPIAAIEEKHLRAPASKDEPLVLLLGCDVKRAPIVYQNAVERLKTKHAGVVLGTLSTVLGPHAAAFAIALVEALSEAEASPTPMKFGDVLLDIKRKRLSAGDPFALTLVAYGDSEIRI
ncbi:MAG TPA: hypothetical protein VE010_02660, partial [Thermoanaerobaculia bacterium]|nr:hypothetical protein [Thermoanaerobaculia bacterium]